MSNVLRMSRRSLLTSGGKAALYLGAIGIAPKFIRPGRAYAADALAAGMIGGPTGFDGAERYQYGEDTPEGRAIEAVKVMKAAGKATKIVAMMSDVAIGQLTKPFPAGAPSVKDLWEKETGITLELVSVPPNTEFTKAMQDIATRGAAFDIYVTEWNRLGDLAESQGIQNLDEFRSKYNPEWDDPERGYVGGAQGVSLLNEYRGSAFGVSLDGDFQCWVYRKDLFEDDKERQAFKARYGYDLDYPKTWKQLDEAAAFFHRPDQGLLGCTDLRNQAWGYPNWYQRYVSSAAPNQFLFDDDGTPLINSDQGINAAREYVDTLAYHSPDAISWGWPEQYGNMSKGGSAMTCAFSNMPKFIDNPANTDSVVQGKMTTSFSPGREIDGALIRRSVLWFSITATVSNQSKNSELAYLFLQWLGSSRIFSWMIANPAGYGFDPFQLANMNDPLVAEMYHDYHLKTIRETIKRSVPTINFAGATALHNALDENLLGALTKSKTPEEAMADTEREWKRIIRKLGEDRFVEAVKANKAAWPTLIDPIA